MHTTLPLKPSYRACDVLVGSKLHILCFTHGACKILFTILHDPGGYEIRMIKELHDSSNLNALRRTIWSCYKVAASSLQLEACSLKL